MTVLSTDVRGLLLVRPVADAMGRGSEGLVLGPQDGAGVMALAGGTKANVLCCIMPRAAASTRVLLE